MAESNDVLTCQFIAKMNGDDSLPSRLLVARQVFKSQSIPMFNKEEQVLLQVNKLASANASDLPLIFDCLIYCFESKRLTNFSGDLGPKVIDSLIEVFSLPETVNEETRCAALRCAISLFSSPYFQRWFSCDVSNFSTILSNLFKIASSSSFNEIVKLLSLTLYIGQQTLFKDENRAAFLESTYVPLCSITEIIPDDEYCSLRSRVTDVICSVVLYDPAFLEEFCLSKKDLTDEEIAVPPPSRKFISKLKTTMKSGKNSRTTMMACCKMFLLSSVKATSKKDNLEKVFDVFTTICYILGCKVDKKKSISWKPLKKWDHIDSFKIIAELIQILDASDVPLNIDYGTYSLESWFMSLVIGTVNINLTCMSSELMTMVERVFKYEPLIIENCAKSIVEIMICDKSEETLQSYVSLMKAIFEGVSQIQRLPKFVFTILSLLKTSLDARSSTIDSITLNGVLPRELSEYFAEIIMKATNSQVLIIFQDLINRFQLDCLNCLEAGSTDSAMVITTEVICELLKQVLSSAKIADHSVPQDVKNKFSVLLEDLGRILEQIGTILESDHNDRLLKSFLDICHSYGALQLMIEEYEGSPIKPLKKQDFTPLNLTYVHPYLSSQSWVSIGTKVTEHSDCLALQSLCHLLVQKVEAVAQVEEGAEGPGTLTARHLLSISKPEWLWNEMTNLAALFQAKEVLHLIEALMNSFGIQQDRWLELIKHDEFCENRRLILALYVQTLTKAAEFVDENNLFYKKVTSHIAGSNLLEYELSLLITEDEELQEEINNSIKAIQNIIDERLKLDSFDEKKFLDMSFIRVLHTLPLHHFSPLSQTCLSLATLSLLIELPPYEIRDNMLLDIFFRVLKDYSNNIGRLLVSDVNPGSLVKYLAVRGGNYPSMKPLLKLICKAALYEKKTTKKLVKAVSKPTVETIWQTAMVIEAINQFKVKKKVDNDAEGDEKEEKTDALVDKKELLTKLIQLVVPIMEQETPSLKLLPTFSAVVSLQLRMRDDFGATTLRNKIGEYLELCPLDPEKGISFVETLILFKNQIENEGIRKMVALDGWKLLMQSNGLPKLSTKINSIFTSSTDEEFKLVTVDLLTETSKAFESKNEHKLLSLMELWGILVSSIISFNKSKIRQEVLVSLAKYIIPVLERWTSSDNDHFVEPLLTFFTSYSSATSVEIKSSVLDTYLVCLQAVPLPTDQPSILLKNLLLAVEAFFALYLFRSPIILDRLHVYLPLYKLYLKKLASVSQPDSEHLNLAIPCAVKLERVAKTLVKRQKDFGRLAEFVIADVLSILAQHRLHSEVKLKYTNIINTFLVLCDEHAIAYLTFSLPSASQELFKTLHSDFKKYHKYVGKI